MHSLTRRPDPETAQLIDAVAHELDHVAPHLEIRADARGNGRAELPNGHAAVVTSDDGRVYVTHLDGHRLISAASFNAPPPIAARLTAEHLNALADIADALAG